MDPGDIRYVLGTQYDNSVVDFFLLGKNDSKEKDQVNYQENKLMNFELQNELLLINIFEQDTLLQVIITSMEDVELVLEYKIFPIKLLGKITNKKTTR